MSGWLERIACAHLQGFDRVLARSGDCNRRRAEQEGSASHLFWGWWVWIIMGNSPLTNLLVWEAARYAVLVNPEKRG